MAIQIPKAIFLHIPKTGGTFVTNYLRETGLSHNVEELELRAHINGAELRDIVGPTEDLIFCFIRHPLTWYRSFWQHRKDLYKGRENDFLDPLVDQPFNRFIADVIQKYPGYLTNFFKSYTERCRFIGKQEHLREDLDNILRYLRIPYNRDYLFSRPLDNVAPSDQRYTKELALYLMETEKVLVDLYNYNYLPLEVL